MNTPASLDSIFVGCTERQLKKGQIIDIFDENHLHLIRTGYIKRYIITKEGDYAIQAIYAAGQLFPLTTVMKKIFDIDLANERKTYYYQAITDVTISSIPMPLLLKRLEDNVYNYRHLLRETAIRLRSNIQQLDNKSLRFARWRIAHQLVFLTEQFGQQVESGVKISVPLTQVDISSMLNITRETVSRIMPALYSEGLLHYDKGHFIIDSKEKLQEIYT